MAYAIDESDRREFAYGTLPGHPEIGKELFAVRLDPASEKVFAEVPLVVNRNGLAYRVLIR